MSDDIRGKKGERGQSFTELAISIVFLLTLLAALIDLGWAFYTMIALRDAAQEAAVYGAMCPHHEALIVDRLRQSASAPLDMNDIPYVAGDPSHSQIRICFIDPHNPPASCDSGPVVDSTAVVLGDGVRVEAWVNHEIRTPFVASFIGTTSYPLRVNVVDTVMRVNDNQGCQ